MLVRRATPFTPVRAVAPVIPPGGPRRPSSQSPVPTSDPTAVASAPPLDMELIPDMNLPYRVTGRVGPLPWSAVLVRATTAYSGLGLTLVKAYPPSPGPGSIFGRFRRGWGTVIGEAGLVLHEKSIWNLDKYSSFIVLLDLWVDPPLDRPTVDGPELPHVWKVEISGGIVETQIADTRHGPEHRVFVGGFPVDPGLGWVPPEVLKRLG